MIGADCESLFATPDFGANSTECSQGCILSIFATMPNVENASANECNSMRSRRAFRKIIYPKPL